MFLPVFIVHNIENFEFPIEIFESDSSLGQYGRSIIFL